jgi:putative DNA primase/helicase
VNFISKVQANAASNASQSWSPTIEEACKFLELLDPDQDSFLFSSFDDNAERDRRRRAKIEDGVPPEERLGSINSLQRWIAERQGLGANICVSAQAMRGAKRRVKELAYIRTIFGEFDREPLREFPLEPSIINETSPGKQHVYWLLDPEHPITAEEFDATQRGIVQTYGADPNAKDVARTLRLAGTWNLKPDRDPFRVRTTSKAGMRYTRSEILAAIPPIERDKARAGPKPDFAKFRGKGDLKRFIALLRHIPADDYHEWISVGMALHHESGGSAEGFRIWDAWSATSVKWFHGECDYRWRTFTADGGITGGTLYEIAKAFGYQAVNARTPWRPTISPVVPATEGEEIPALAVEIAKPSALSLPEGFRRAADACIEYAAGTDTETGEEIWKVLCSPIEIVAATRDADEKNWGLILRIQTPDGKWHQQAVPRALMVTQSEDLLGALAGLGLRFSPVSRIKNALKRMLAMAAPEGRGRAVMNVGWSGQQFVMPDGPVGDDGGETIVFQPPSPIAHAYRISGTLEGWQDGVATKALGNSRLVFSIAAAFSGPLLQLVDMDSAGFNWRATSSKGKTTLLRAAASVWGGGGRHGFLRQWRTTDNALESVCLTHCDTFLALDEISQVSAKAAGIIAYMIANGQSKARSGKSGDARPIYEWKTTFLSSGELSLEDKIAEAGGRSTAGQMVRVIDLPADAGAGMGVFEELHGAEGPAEFVKLLRDESTKHYGHAARAFIEKPTSDIDGSCTLVSSLIGDFVGTVCPVGADGQVQRVAERFGLMAAAGEIAARWSILPWPQSTATKAARDLFREWLKARGGSGPIEVKLAIEKIREIIERDGASRFTNWETPSDPTIKRLGFFRRAVGSAEVSEYYVLSSGWREMTQGFDGTPVARELVRLGILNQPDRSGKYSIAVNLPIGKQRCYVLNAARLMAEDSGE